MSKKNKFPDKLFVHIDGEGDDALFIADQDIDGVDDGKRVAVYELREIRAKIVTHSLTATPAK